MAVPWKEIVPDLKSSTRSEALPLFCFDCCFHPCRSQPQCYTDSHVRHDPREVEPDAEPILNLKHSTPRWRPQVNRTPDMPCTPITPIPLNPHHKSVEEEWCSSMATPSPLDGFPGRSCERKFLQSTTSSLHTDVSLVVQSLIDDDMLLNPVRDRRCSAMFPAADSTPRRMRQCSSPKVKQLVAMFNIEEDSLHRDVVRVTSQPNMTSELSLLNSPLTGVDQPTTPRQCTPGGLLPSPQDCSQDLFCCTTPPVGANPTVGRARKRTAICSELSIGDFGDCVVQSHSGVLVDENPIPPVRGGVDEDPIPPVCGGVDEDPIPPVRGGVDEDPIPPIRGGVDEDPIPLIRGGVDEDPIPLIRGGVDEDPIPPVRGELVQDSTELTTLEVQPRSDISHALEQKNVLSTFAYPMNNTSARVEATAVICEEQPQTDNQHKTVRRASNSKAEVCQQLHPQASGSTVTEAHLSPLTLPDTIMSCTPEGIADQQVTNGTGCRASCSVVSRKRLSRPKRSQKRRRTDSDRELPSDGASPVEVHQDPTLNRGDCLLLAKTCKGDKDAISIREGQLQQEEGSSCIEPLSNAPSNFTNQTVHRPAPHNHGPLHPQSVTSPKLTLTAPKVRSHTGRRSAVFKPPRSMKDVSMKEEMASRRKLLKGFGIDVDVKKDATSPSLLNVPLTSCLFQTASGKSCQPSLESMSTARQFLQTLTDELTSGECVTPNTMPPCLESNPPFMSGSHIPPSVVGFSTASGKKLTASSESISRAKQLLGEECSTSQGSCSVVQTRLEEDRCVGMNNVEDHQRVDDVPEGLGSHVHTGQDKATSGFSTASGKTLTVSARAMELGRSLLEQVSDSSVSAVCRTANGFSTASGKRLSVSAGAVQQARDILSTRESTVHDLVDDVVEGVQGGVVEGVRGGVVEGVQGGVVDEQSQVKSIDSLDLDSFTKFTQLPQPGCHSISDAEETHENSQYSSPTEDLPNEGPTEDLPVQRPTEDLPVQGATEDLPVQGATEDLPGEGPTGESLSSTATLDSSADFLADLNTQALNELHSSPEEEIKYCSEEESSKSDNSLAEAKVTGSHEVCLTTSQSTTGETMCPAVEVLGTSFRTPTFQTASGRAVSVKEESLQHVRSRMEESLPVTLQTASGKEVTIPQPALDQAKSLLATCNHVGYDNAEVSTSLSSMFSTASGRSVGVSKKALQAVKENLVKSDGSTVKDVSPISTSVGITVSNQELPPPGNQMLHPFLCPRQRERPQGPSAETGVTPERRYVPKFISHKGGAAPNRTPSEQQTPLKNCNYSQAPSSTFRPCVHSTPEAFLADRQNLKKSFLISELHTPPLRTQMKKFIYSVPFRPRAGKTGGGVSRSSSPNCNYYKPIVKTPSTLLISPRTTPTSHQVTPTSSQVTPTTPQVTPTNPRDTPTSPQITPTSPQVTPKNPQVNSKDSFMGPNDPGEAPHSWIHPLLERPVDDDQSLEVTGDIHLSESQLTVFMDMTQPSVSNTDLKSLEQHSHMPCEHTLVLPKHAHTSLEGSHTLLEHTPTPLRHNNQSSDVMEDSGIGTLPSSGNTSRQSPRGVDHPPVVIKRANIASHSEPKSKRMRTEVVDTLNNTMVCFNQVKHSSVSTGTVRPQDGLLYSIRKAHRGHLVPLRALGGRRGQYTSEQLLAMGVHPSVLQVSVERAVDFRFPGYLHFSSSVLKGQPVRVGDGAVLHLGQDSSAGVDELERAFSTTPGVDPRLVSSNWFKNHYKWIVWKLASLEVVFPRQCARRSLTPNWLMLQMKYRYDVEIDHAHRSALKRIYEHDDTPAKTMVLCVSGLGSSVGGLGSSVGGLGSSVGGLGSSVGGLGSSVGGLGSSGVSMELSDGWYSIGGAVDQVLERMVQRGLIGMGSKLCVSGAELSGLDSPSPPLEAPQGVFLRLHANSTRRARWNAKLGFQGNPEPIHVPLGSIFPDGGKVGSTSFLITRVYPLIYMEKTPDGGKIFRSCRAEEQEERRFGKHRQKVLEKICDRETRLFEEDIAKEEVSSWSKSKRNRRPNSRSIKNLDSGEDLYNAMQQASDLVSFQEWLSPMQKALLMSYKDNIECQRKDRLQKRIQQALLEAEEKELPAQRDVVPLLKARVAEVNRDLSAAEATLCVWRPSSDARQLLKEGVFLKAYHLQASEGRSRGGGLQLTATKFTKYQELKLLCLDKYSPRRVTPLSDLSEAKVHSEVDVVGVVSHITSDSVMTAKGRAHIDCVGLSDPSGHSAVIKVWDGLSALGYKDLVQPGAVLSVTNLRVTMHNTTAPTPPVLLASDVSVFSQSPKEAYLKENLADLKTKI